MRTDPPGRTGSSGRAGPPDAPSRRPLLDALDIGGLLLGGNGKVVACDPALAGLLGRAPETVTGRRLADLAADGPGESAGALAELTGLAGDVGRERWAGALELRHADGGPVPLEGRAARIAGPDGRPLTLVHLVAAGRTGAVEQDLAALDALFTASPLGIALFDRDLRYTRVNRALAALHGTPAHALIGRTVLDALPPPVSQEIHRLQRHVLRTGRSVTDLVTASPDGRGAHSVSVGPLTDRAGETAGLGCTVMDITERREALARTERARQRLTLLDDVGTALGDLLDVGRVCEALADALVPRFGDFCSVQLTTAVATGGEPPDAGEVPGAQLIQLGVATTRGGPEVKEIFRYGSRAVHPPGSILGTVLATGVPHLARSPDEILAATPPGHPRAEATRRLGIHSMLTIPLRARGTVLGLLVVSRAGRRAAFDRDDLTLAAALSTRAGITLDNVRLYVREREGALMLQRSLLPRELPTVPGVEVGHRYVPSSSGAEIGGDWFDVIPLAGGRVALVIGDATGHGMRAAAVMGQLRTAVRTLAGLDLSPAELLRRLNDIGTDIAPHPDPLMATCVYAVYDPATRVCTMAGAGHLPPMLATREDGGGRWEARQVDLPAGVPLGLEDVRFEERRVEVAEGSLLVLYTDGLVETRGESIAGGLERLRRLLARAAGATAAHDSPLEALCDEIVGALRPEVPAHDSDDLALLAVRLGRLPAERVMTRAFPAERHMVREARHQVRETLRDWGLTALADRAELLVSELVTNAVRHARGPVGLRMVHGPTLLVEVTDPDPAPPRERTAAPEDEGGRGLPLVARESRRWGSRRVPAGKTVWFELGLPG
ncbi:SpoIIE family protein phosphatase [Streptomyces sp. DSM 44917]|uniref:SpoIIE family protein phosphatase n=1 Tax=Streptomyces boetiae TaxID=3075541 RepID=A0ABU2L8R6_9ACTN|nr:SpoIIE family protein phosphatase [Streptomyces sp. DSM 44917]MDT0307732.1 SpoIIE family protein phosphatase [Streptomyces sp. DSM 44917]